MSVLILGLSRKRRRRVNETAAREKTSLRRFVFPLTAIKNKNTKGELLEEKLNIIIFKKKKAKSLFLRSVLYCT